MPLPEYPEKIAGLDSEELDGLDEVIYVRTEDGASFSLNLTAAAVLDLCNGQRSCREIAAEIEEISVPGGQNIVADVEHIIEQFVDCGLVYADDDSEHDDESDADA